MVIQQHFACKNVLVYLVHAYLKEHTSNGISHPSVDEKQDGEHSKKAAMLVHIKRLAAALDKELANDQKNISELSVKALLQHLEDLGIDIRVVREFLISQVSIDNKANETMKIDPLDLAYLQRVGMLLNVRLFIQELDKLIAKSN